MDAETQRLVDILREHALLDQGGINMSVLFRAANKIEELQRKINQQDKRLSDYSWSVNPDTSGGAFTQDEIDRSRNGGWQ